MLVLLVGPKGSGKSHIGRVLERELEIPFFHVESLWAELRREDVARGETRSIEDGIRVVHPQIEEALEEGHVTVETTGGSPEILNDLLRIGERCGRCLVRVSAPLDLCMKRIRERDASGQIPVPEEVILKIYRRFEALSLPWDLELLNTALSDEAIKAAFEDRL